MKVAIFTEDTYAPKFIKNVINRLISEGFISTKIEFAKLHTPSLIKKCHNVRKVLSVVRDVDRILILIDKENSDEYDEDRDVWRHLRNLKEQDKRKIVVIATEPEIEEWICESLDIPFDKTGKDLERKPSKILGKNHNYKKSKLPKYAENLDFEKLLRKSKSFKEFYLSLKFKDQETQPSSSDQ